MDKFSLKLSDNRVQNFLNKLQQRQIEISNVDGQSNLMDKLANIQRQIVDVDEQLQELNRTFASNVSEEEKPDRSNDSADLAKMVEDEFQQLSIGRHSLENQLLREIFLVLLSEGDVLEKFESSDDVILEVSAGVGGQEAMLFTQELFQLYRQYAQYQNWKFDVLESDETDLGGLHKAAASISGKDAYLRLRFEGGVHRVQRVPATERTGRVHTSTASVAVLAQMEDIVKIDENAKINLKQFKIESCRPSGPGGQNVNKNDTACRITHLPSGVSVTCQMERQFHLNRAWALRRVLAILRDRETGAQRELVERSRKLQVGSRGRSEKIRTYNTAQDRVTDHRLRQAFFGVPDILSGGRAFDELVNDLLRLHLEERLSEALDEQLRRNAEPRTAEGRQASRRPG